MIRTYWDILGRYKWSIVVCPVLVLVFVVCETLQPMLMARIVDEGVMHRDIAVVTRIGIWMLGISVAGLLANITNVFVSSNASVGFATELRSRLFRKIQEFSFAEMDKFNSASLITRLTGDVTRLQQVVLLGLRILLRSPMMLVMAFFYVVRIDSGLALIVAGAIPVLGISVYLILRKGFPYFLKMQQKVDAVNAVVRENLINMRVVKSFVRERYESRKFSASNRDLCDVSVKASNIIVTIFPVMQLVLNLSVIVVLWVGGERVAAGRLQVGELVSLVNYLMQILMSLMMLSMIIMNIARASASSDRVLEVLGTEPSLKDSPGASAVVRRGAVGVPQRFFPVRWRRDRRAPRHLVQRCAGHDGGCGGSDRFRQEYAVAACSASLRHDRRRSAHRRDGCTRLSSGTASCAGGDGVAEQRPLQRYDSR